MNIFIGSLSFNINEAELREVFAAYGEVSSAKLITDKFSGRSKGFGFVEMPDDDEAKKAIEGLNGKELSGRRVVVNKAEERGSRGGGGGNFGGNNRGGGGGYRDNDRGYNKKRY